MAGAVLSIIAGAGILLAVLGCGYLVAAIVLTGRFADDRGPERPASFPGVALLKPLCGAEPWLFDNLASFCRQSYPGPVTMVCGVMTGEDGAAAVVEELQRTFPRAAIDLVVDPLTHGANRKVSNLANMAARIDQPIVIVSDSDVRVERDYLSRVVAALTSSGVGGVTCLYYGVPGEGHWSALAALGIDGHFLPSVIVGLAVGRAQPCFGSTIALRRQTLDSIGGFAVAHRCEYGHWRDLWAQELRWARTLRSIDPAGYAGSVIVHPFAWALLALAAGGGAPALALAFCAIGGRMALLWRLERAFGIPRHPYWLIPMRDLFSAAVYLTSYLGRDVVWRGRRYRIGPDGRMSERRTKT